VARAILVLASLLAPSLPAGQRQSPLIGAWRLVSFLRADSLGVERPVWDERPIGLLIYLPDGTMAAQLFDSRRPPFQASTESIGAEAAGARAFAGLLAYHGTFTVDTVARRVIHRIVGAWRTDWIGRDVVRGYRFVDPDHLELRVVSNADGAAPPASRLLWERVRR
jgi:hypothetical protein